jgi:outer membrane receptor protein involved in Fe transport
MLNQCSLRIVLIAAVMSGVVRAQDTATPAPASDDLGEIVVTARQRTERLLDVPVAVTVIGAADINRYASTELVDIAQIAPQVMIAQVGSGSGTSFIIRGIGSSTLDSGLDQSVAINVDGVLSSRGRSVQQSYFDLADVEVLKGPQALFFGKNTPAGVISLSSANPTKEFSVEETAGYEFVAQEITNSGYISSPITDTLGIRFAYEARQMRGWMQNLAADGLPGAEPATGLDIYPADKWGPKQREFNGRLTLAFNPVENFSAIFKFNSGISRDNGEGTNGEVVYCPSGRVQNPGEPPDPFTHNCSANGTTSYGTLPSQLVYGVVGAHNNGSGQQSYQPLFTSLKANWTVGPVNLTSVTGFNRYADVYFSPGFEKTVYDLNFGSQEEIYKSFSQELRALTSFDSPLNFMAGVYYETEKLDNLQAFRIAALPVDPATGYYYSIGKGGVIKSSTYSAFGQVIYNLTPTLEFDAGVRWSRDLKNMTQANTYVQPELAAGFPLTPFVGSYANDNTSPEATLTWHPSSQSTLYAAYKTGYKSGGFGLPAILSGGTQVSDLEFKPEKVKGGEVGAKGLFMDGRLRIDSDVYLYDFSDLQVDVFNGTTITYQILNAAAARAEGVETDLHFDASSNLELRAALGYNRTRYRTFNSPCYGGQTIAEGCNMAIQGGAYTEQNLAGSPTVQAPDWSGNAGFTYKAAVADSLKFAFTGDLNGMSRYYFSEQEGPGTIQGGYVLIDSSIRLISQRGHTEWTLALIGKNLTNRWIIAGGSDRPNSGSGTGTATGVPADILGYLDRPRQVILQLSGKY